VGRIDSPWGQREMRKVGRFRGWVGVVGGLLGRHVVQRGYREGWCRIGNLGEKTVKCKGGRCLKGKEGEEGMVVQTGKGKKTVGELHKLAKLVAER